MTEQLRPFDAVATCPKCGRPIAFGYDWDGDEHGVWANHWAECLAGHHYRAEWVAPDEFRAIWEE